jgi:signal transduction histidine kinase
MKTNIKNFMHNISIVRKTAIIIFVAMLGILYLGVFGFVSLGQLHDKFNTFYNTNYKSIIKLEEFRSSDTNKNKIWTEYKKIEKGFDKKELQSYKKILNDIDTQLDKKSYSINSNLSKLIQLHSKHAKLRKDQIDFEQSTVSKLIIGLTLFLILFSILFTVSITKSIDGLIKAFSTIAAKKMHEYENLAQNYESKVTKEIDRNREKDQIMYHNSRLAAMGEMIGNIAHQWRQPLNALTVLIQSFGTKSMTGKLDQAFIDQQIEEGLRLANQMSSTIEDFRNFFSPHNEREYFGVRESLEDTLELVEFFCKDEQIDIQVQYKAELRVFGYSNEFAQVIFNLINNARDNFKQRDIKDNRKIIIKLEKKEIRGKQMALISFIDNGGGVDPKIKDRIFEPYFTTKHKSTGTGIGLYMSKQIIEKQMQGLVTMKNIQSKLGGDKVYKCAQFIIAIPIR